MSKWFSLVLAVVVVANCAPAGADELAWLTRLPAQEEVAPVTPLVEDAPYLADPLDALPPLGTKASGDGFGYPFRNRCCQQQRPCCDTIWNGFCHPRHGGCRSLGWFGGCASGCAGGKGGECLGGKGGGPCRQKGCAPCQKAPCGPRRPALRRLPPVKGGCVTQGQPATKGLSAKGLYYRSGCGKAGLHFGRPGLFDWSHHGGGCACGGDAAVKHFGGDGTVKHFGGDGTVKHFGGHGLDHAAPLPHKEVAPPAYPYDQHHPEAPQPAPVRVDEPTLAPYPANSNSAYRWSPSPHWLPAGYGS